MSYSDLWTTNLLTQLPKKLAEGKHLHILPPPITKSARGDVVFPKTTAFPPIPKEVTHLELMNHDIGVPLHIREGIRWLDISGSGTSYAFVFPNSLEALIWRDCDAAWWEGKFSHLPALKQLDWSNRSITHLPDLPPTLEILQLENCRQLTELPPLPDGLRVLDIRGCTALKTLPEIPVSVEEIWCVGCDSLRPRRIVEEALNYWDIPVWFRAYQEKKVQERIQKRTRSLRQEIVAAAYHPRRVERWLEQRGWDILEEMLG